MTEPQSETPTPAPRNTRAANNQSAQAENTAPASSGKFLVKTPWSCSEFHVREGLVVTPDGAELNGSEKDEAVAAAKSVRMKLRVQEAGN